MKIYHEARINGSADISSERIPTFRVEEVPEFFEIMIDQELGGPVIEPGIKLVNDGLVTNDREYSDESGD